MCAFTDLWPKVVDAVSLAASTPDSTRTQQPPTMESPPTRRHKLISGNASHRANEKRIRSQNVRTMWPAIRVAKEVGAGLAEREVLLAEM